MGKKQERKTGKNKRQKEKKRGKHLDMKIKRIRNKKETNEWQKLVNENRKE